MVVSYISIGRYCFGMHWVYVAMTRRLIMRSSARSCCDICIEWKPALIPYWQTLNNNKLSHPTSHPFLPHFLFLHAFLNYPFTYSCRCNIFSRGLCYIALNPRPTSNYSAAQDLSFELSDLACFSPFANRYGYAHSRFPRN